MAAELDDYPSNNKRRLDSMKSIQQATKNRQTKSVEELCLMFSQDIQDKSPLKLPHEDNKSQSASLPSGRVTIGPQEIARLF